MRFGESSPRRHLRVLFLAHPSFLIVPGGDLHVNSVRRPHALAYVSRCESAFVGFSDWCLSHGLEHPEDLDHGPQLNACQSVCRTFGTSAPRIVPLVTPCAMKSIRAWFPFHCPTLQFFGISCPSQNAEIININACLCSFQAAGRRFESSQTPQVFRIAHEEDSKPAWRPTPGPPALPGISSRSTSRFTFSNDRSEA